MAFFVSPDGSDTNPGTQRRPFKTVEHARLAVQKLADRMTGNITVYLRGGTHRLTSTLRFTSEDSGRNGFKIIYRNYPGEMPVLSGGRMVTAWHPRDRDDASDRVYVAAVEALDNDRSFYVNGMRASRTRIAGPGARLCPPTCPSADSKSKNPYVAWLQNDSGYVTDNAPSLEHARNPAAIEFVYSYLWTETRCLVERVTGNTVAMQGATAQAPGCFHAMTVKASHQRMLPTVIENVYEYLNAPGQWYLDRFGGTGFPVGTIFYLPRSTENLRTAEAVLPALETLIVVQGTPASKVHNLIFKGLAFEHTYYRQPSTATGFAEGQANFTTLPDGNAAQVPAAVVLQAVDRMRIERCHFTHLGGAGLNLEHGATHVEVQGNVFSDISSSGIQIGDPAERTPAENAVDSDITVSDNYIHDIGVEYHGAIGIWAGYTRNLLIAHNQLNDFPFTGISIGWGWGGGNSPIVDNNRIMHNLLYNGVQYLMDGGCIYSLGDKRGDNVLHPRDQRQWIQGNVCHHMNNQFGGLYADNGSGHITYVNNIVYASDNHNHSYSDKIYNIIFHQHVAGITLQYSFSDYGRERILDDPWIDPGTGKPAGQALIQTPYTPDPPTDIAQFPASILNAAGLEASYRDLLPSQAQSTDRQAPTAPTGVKVVKVWRNGAQLQWRTAQDGQGVTGYEIDGLRPVDYVLAASRSTNAIIGNPPDSMDNAGDLTASTRYTVVVRARDAAGNLSKPSRPVTFLTSAKSRN